MKIPANPTRDPGTHYPVGAGVLPGLLLISLALLSVTIPLGSGGLVLASFLPALPCPFLELTGLPCPFCGMTRAFLSLGRLDLAQALGFSAAGCLLFVYLSAYALVGWAYLGSRWRRLERLLRQNHWPCLLAAVLVLWAMRLTSLP